LLSGSGSVECATAAECRQICDDMAGDLNNDEGDSGTTWSCTVTEVVTTAGVLADGSVDEDSQDTTFTCTCTWISVDFVQAGGPGGDGDGNWTPWWPPGPGTFGGPPGVPVGCVDLGCDIYLNCGDVLCDLTHCEQTSCKTCPTDLVPYLYPISSGFYCFYDCNIGGVVRSGATWTQSLLGAEATMTLCPSLISYVGSWLEWPWRW
jgi:hypothetical protein